MACSHTAEAAEAPALWTGENRQFVDRSKPAISPAAETSEFLLHCIRATQITLSLLFGPFDEGRGKCADEENLQWQRKPTYDGFQDADPRHQGDDSLIADKAGIKGSADQEEQIERQRGNRHKEKRSSQVARTSSASLDLTGEVQRDDRWKQVAVSEDADITDHADVRPIHREELTDGAVGHQGSTGYPRGEDKPRKAGSCLDGHVRLRVLRNFAWNHGIFVGRVDRAQPMIAVSNDNFSIARISYQKERG